MRTVPRWMVGVCFVGAACGSVDSGSSGSSSGGTGGTGGTGANFCPATEPLGSSCAGVPEAFRCTYGDSVRPDCRHDWTCLNGVWTTTKSTCIEPPPANCMFATPPSGVCMTDGDVCVIGASTICICTSCAGGPCMAPPPTWTCAGPPMTTGCPEVVPNDGTACKMQGLVCTYGNICTISGAQVKCENGLWKWNQLIACPA